MSTQLPTAPSPAQPKEDFKSYYWKLTYRLGRQTFPISFQEDEKITLEQAMEKGKDYCRQIRVQFVNVEPCFHRLVDLIQEKQKTRSDTPVAEREPGKVY